MQNTTYHGIWHAMYSSDMPLQYPEEYFLQSNFCILAELDVTTFWALVLEC